MAWSDPHLRRHVSTGRRSASFTTAEASLAMAAKPPAMKPAFSTLRPARA